MFAIAKVKMILICYALLFFLQNCLQHDLKFYQFQKIKVASFTMTISQGSKNLKWMFYTAFKI